MKEFISKEDKVEAYLANKLNEQELEDFELWLADNPETLTGIQQQLAIKTAAHQVFDNKAEVRTKSSLTRWQQLKDKFLYTALGATFASLMAVMIFHTSHQEKIEANIPILVLSHKRGAETGAFKPTNTLKILPEMEQIILVTQTSSFESGDYTVKVRSHKNDTQVANIGHLKLLGSGDLQAAVPVQLLPPGEYWVDVFYGHEKIESIPFATE